MIQEFLRGQLANTQESVAHRTLPQFKPKQIPTYITFSNPNKVLELAPGDSANIVALTDARDDVIPKAKFQLSISNPAILRASLTSHYAGRWIIRISAYPNAEENSTCELNATLEYLGAWICKTAKPLRIKINVPSLPKPYLGCEPPTKFRIKTQGSEVRLQEGKQRVIWVDTDCVDDLLTRLIKPAIFEVALCPQPIILKGFNQPLRGQIGINVSTPAETSPLEPGNIEVRLNLADGSCLSDKAPIRIVPQPPRGGLITIQNRLQVPNYEVVYVREQPSEITKSWHDMQDEFGQEWDKEDVGGYTITPDAQGNDKLVIFINHDFTDFVMEQRNWGHRNENWVKRMTNLYDAQVAFQCYQASIGRGDKSYLKEDSSNGYHFIPREYPSYRAEMVRVGKTILWARKKFGTALPEDTALS